MTEIDTLTHASKRHLMFACLCLGTTHLALASEIRVYEWHEPNGVISISQRPPPAGTSGVSSREITVASLTPAQRAAAKAYLASVDRKQTADADRFRRQVVQADTEVKKALAQLAERERTLEANRTPGPGDRVGNARGGTRLRGEYFDRQRDFEKAVQDARASVAEAYKSRDALVD
jgi:hypothetical protein